MKAEVAEDVIITRKWAMPSMHTFTIKPIADLLNRYVGDGKNWADPFAGENSPAEFTNDLNPKKRAIYHLTCEEFAKIIPPVKGVLFDKPYSGRQMKEVYEGVGLKFGQKESQQVC